ncbi:putative F-box and FNIP repeat-containing protein [Powai lake megavirus]|uniref:Putative F-box and FNIP repeat-containing protein n=1 Tax=Powai lake megavirus TaxID=1842663 RepID=A0A167R1N3_9VIRU|nr:putative F-box and FNIP repeat-containing protein [Powai lake megavirus]ANB50206.1 putative F-box and FNIP repeat-containing protein [Powai lake megavirus]
MKTIINYLNHDVLLLIFDLLSDRDKIRFTMINQFMSQYINYIIYTDLHEYERVRFLPFKNNFRRLSFRPRYDIIPPIITDLIIGKDYVGSLKNAIPKSVKKLTIDYGVYQKNKKYIRSDIFLHFTGRKLSFTYNFYDLEIYGSEYWCRTDQCSKGAKCGISKILSFGPETKNNSLSFIAQKKVDLFFELIDKNSKPINLSPNIVKVPVEKFAKRKFSKYHR